jgi:hypothetical protein
MRGGRQTEAESKKKQGVWDPMPELTLSSPYVHYRVDSNSFNMGNPMKELTLTLCQRRHDPMPESTLSPSPALWIGPQSRSKQEGRSSFFQLLFVCKWFAYVKSFISKILLDFSASKTTAVILDCVSKAAFQLRF